MRDGGITPEQSIRLTCALNLGLSKDNTRAIDSIDMCAELGFVVFSSAHTLLFPSTIPHPCQKLRVEIIKDRVTPHDAEVTIEIP